MTQPTLLKITESNPNEMDIEARLQLTAAVHTYIRYERQYNEAAERFNESCSQLRQLVWPNMKLVLRHDWCNHLLTTNAGGDFELEEVSSL